MKSLTELAILARDRLGSDIVEVHQNIFTVSVVLNSIPHNLEELFPECHVHWISRSRIGLVWK